MRYYNEPFPHYQFERLSLEPRLKHFVSTRAGGVSPPEGMRETMNLSFSAGDSREVVLENRHRIAVGLSATHHQLLIPSQNHGLQIKECDLNILRRSGPPYEALQDTDALITTEIGLCIAVLVADCVPILLYDPQKRVIAAVHAGWRGTVGKIAARTVLKMQKDFSCKLDEIIACIGPSIGPEVYEVGGEVIAAFHEAFQEADHLHSKPNAQGKALLNLWEANRRQLTEVGVGAQNISIAGLCTYSMPDIFYSARRAGGKGGRFAAGIMMS